MFDILASHTYFQNDKNHALALVKEYSMWIVVFDICKKINRTTSHD